MKGRAGVQRAGYHVLFMNDAIQASVFFEGDGTAFGGHHIAFRGIDAHVTSLLVD
jgi:hypothetical protein